MPNPGFLFWKHTSFTMVLKVYFRKHLQNFCYYKLNFVQKIMRKYKTGRIFAFSLKNWSKKVKLLIWVRPQGFNAIYEHSVKILKCLNCVLTHFKKWCCPFKCVSHVRGGGHPIHLQKVSYVINTTFLCRAIPRQSKIGDTRWRFRQEYEIMSLTTATSNILSEHLLCWSKIFLFTT